MSYRHIAALICLTGCATPTPNDLRQTEPISYTLKSRLPAAAQCIRDNVEATDGQWSAEIRDTEIFVRVMGQVMAVISLQPKGELTVANLHMGNMYPRAEMAGRYVNGC